MKSDKKLLLTKELIDKMFEIAGHCVRFEDIKDLKDPENPWYTQYTMTEEENKTWKEWGINYIKKKTRLSKALALREMEFFDLVYGLKIKNKSYE